MAKKAKNKSKVKNGLYMDMDFSDLSDALKEAEDMVDKDLLRALGTAYKEATAEARADMLKWFDVEHRRQHSGFHVADAWNDGKPTYSKNRKVSYIFGYDSRQTLVPIFLEYGTPKIKPEWRMKQTHDECEAGLEEVFMDELIKILRPSGLIE